VDSPQAIGVAVDRRIELVVRAQRDEAQNPWIPAVVENGRQSLWELEVRLA
jgi:hypothetical protein